MGLSLLGEWNQPPGRTWRLSLYGCSYRGVRHAQLSRGSPNWPQGGIEPQPELQLPPFSAQHPALSLSFSFNFSCQPSAVPFTIQSYSLVRKYATQSDTQFEKGANEWAALRCCHCVRCPNLSKFFSGATRPLRPLSLLLCLLLSFVHL